jgi:regulator of replication initiation timing
MLLLPPLPSFLFTLLPSIFLTLLFTHPTDDLARNMFDDSRDSSSCSSPVAPSAEDSHYALAADVSALTRAFTKLASSTTHLRVDPSPNPAALALRGATGELATAMSSMLDVLAMISAGTEAPPSSGDRGDQGRPPSEISAPIVAPAELRWVQDTHRSLSKPPFHLSQDASSPPHPLPPPRRDPRKRYGLLPPPYSHTDKTTPSSTVPAASPARTAGPGTSHIPSHTDVLSAFLDSLRTPYEKSGFHLQVQAYLDELNVTRTIARSACKGAAGANPQTLIEEIARRDANTAVFAAALARQQETVRGLEATIAHLKASYETKIHSLEASTALPVSNLESHDHNTPNRGLEASDTKVKLKYLAEENASLVADNSRLAKEKKRLVDRNDRLAVQLEARDRMVDSLRTDIEQFLAAVDKGEGKRSPPISPTRNVQPTAIPTDSGPSTSNANAALRHESDRLKQKLEKTRKVVAEVTDAAELEFQAKKCHIDRLSAQHATVREHVNKATQLVDSLDQGLPTHLIVTARVLRLTLQEAKSVLGRGT